MLVAVPPAQPAAPLEQLAIVRKTTGGAPAPTPNGGAPSVEMPGADAPGAPAIRARRKHRHPHPHTDPHSGFRLAEASWYGGGGSLACGGTLSSWTLGVANKTLPCGTRVTLWYGARKVRVRVIDRGPYVAGREFDLTEATKRALGFGDTGALWWRVR